MSDDKFEFKVGTEAIKGLPGRILQNALQFVTVAVIARFLGASGLGTYSLLFTVIKASEILINGFGEALKKRVSETGTDESKYVGAALLFHFVFILVTTGVGIGFILYFPEHIPMETWGAYFALFAFQAHGLFKLSQELYAAVGEPGEALWFDSLARSLILGSQVIFLWLGYGMEALMIGIFIGTVATAIVGFYVTGVWPSPPTLDVFHELYIFAKYSIPAELLGAAYGYSDTFAIYFLVSATALGQFSAAAQLIVAGAVVGPALAKPLIVKTSNNHSQNEEVTSPLRTSLTFAGILGLPLLSLSIAIPEVMPIIYGPEFAGTGIVIALVAAYSVITVYKQQFIAAFNGIDKPRIPMMIRLAQVIVYIPVIVYAAVYHGFVGFLVASLFIELFGFVLFILPSRKEFDEYVFVRPVVVQVCASIVLYFVATGVFSLVPETILGLIITIFVSVIVYGGLIYAFSERMRTAGQAYAEVAVNEIKKKIN